MDFLDRLGEAEAYLSQVRRDLSVSDFFFIPSSLQATACMIFNSELLGLGPALLTFLTERCSHPTTHSFDAYADLLTHSNSLELHHCRMVVQSAISRCRAARG